MGARARIRTTQAGIDVLRIGLAVAIGLLALAVTTPASAAPPAPGLVAAYSFDEGSGTAVSDASGNGNTGTIAGSTWTTGRYGGALSFDGIDDHVALGGLGTFYNSGFTLEGWVQKQGPARDVAVLGTWAGSGPMLWVDHLAGRYHLTLGGSMSSYLDSGATPVAGQWQHLAATFDGSSARYYVNGNEVAARSVSGAVGTSNTWRVGAYGAIAGGFFDGLIDELRVYDRALGAAEIQADMNTPVTIVNTNAPTNPGNLTVAGRNHESIWVEWSPSTDDVAVTGYRLFVDGVAAGTTSETAFTFAALDCATSYELEVEALDGDGNVSGRAVETASTSLCDDPAGLIAAYSFDEGSGGVVNDASGNGWNGTIVGAAWAAGRYGTALDFDGANAHVALGSLGAFYNGGFTLQAWVKKHTSKKDVAVVGSWTGGPGGPMLWVDHVAGRYHLTLGSTMSGFLDSGRTPREALWQHVAATFDGSTARFYIDGSEVASRSLSGSVGSSSTWRIGAFGAAAGGFFDGLIDDVRIYDRALSAAELRVDMTQPVTTVGAPPQWPPGTPPDTTPPAVTLTGPVGGATVGGIVTLTADATDGEGWVAVRFKIDGQNLGVEDKSSPYAAQWDTRGELNGTHTLGVVARDRSGNTATSSALVTIANTGVSTTGLRVAYGFDEGSGTTAADSSGNHRTATLSAAGWATGGRFGGAVSLDGVAGTVVPPALGTFYRTGLTYEAWVYKQSSKKDATVLGSWVGGAGAGAMIWVDHVSGHYQLALGPTFANYLDSGQAPGVGRWQHVAATYDGSTARFYIDGVETAAALYAGVVGTSNTWRIGAYGSTATGFLDALVDNVRIYDRALSAAEIALNRASRIQPDRTPPTVTAFTPADGATDVSVARSFTATFDEPMQEATVDASTFTLRDGENEVVQASVSYDPTTHVATLTPQGALEFGATYRAALTTNGARDLAGNGLAAEQSWSFTTETAPPPVLVVSSTGNPFGAYLGEILRAEGMNALSTIDLGFVTPTLLSRFDVVLLGQMPLTASQASMLTSWVNSGGNLIAMRPDKQLAGLLGLTPLTSTLSDAYLRVRTGTQPGAGIVGSSIQFHGTSDRYLLAGAASVATLYSNKTTATTSPAVTLRSVGSSGGQAAAFTFDLARSVVYTRQGNPAWAGQERDGVVGVRPGDMFYGAKVGDIRPDWVDTSRIAIPQADEQQRLLANMITLMSRDKLPLPRFWYLPRGEKAVVVMSGDDHSPSQAPGGTASHFDRYKTLSPAGCDVESWECIRATSYIFPDSVLTNAQAAAYVAEGFEIGLHPVIATCTPTPPTPAELGAAFDTQLAAFRAKYTSVPGPVSNRNHCVVWPDWLSNAEIELGHGIRLDGNYYHYPGSWIAAKPGFLNGGGFPMRFARPDGTAVDIYQQNTNMADEAGQNMATTIDALLDGALGSTGYYGAFGANMHTDGPAPHSGAEAIVADAKSRGVPVISYKQLLDWVDGRNDSTIRSLAWNAGTLTFATTAAPGANGLQLMLPVQGPTGTLSTIRRGGTSLSYSVQTIKGVQYAIFSAGTATYEATYS